MTVYTNSMGIVCISADEGKALCRANEEGPTTITSVSLGKGDAPTNWKDCEYGPIEPAPEAV